MTIKIYNSTKASRDNTNAAVHTAAPSYPWFLLSLHCELIYPGMLPSAVASAAYWILEHTDIHSAFIQLNCWNDWDAKKSQDLPAATQWVSGPAVLKKRIIFLSLCFNNFIVRHPLYTLDYFSFSEGMGLHGYHLCFHSHAWSSPFLMEKIFPRNY